MALNCGTEGTIVNNRILAVVDGDCNAPIESEGVLTLTFIIDTQVKLSPADFPPGTTLEQASKDIVTCAAEDFGRLVTMAIHSMRSDDPNGVRVSFAASAHTGCETCEGVKECPMLAEANKYSVIKREDGTEEKGTNEMEETKQSGAEEENPKLRLVHSTLLH